MRNHNSLTDLLGIPKKRNLFFFFKQTSWLGLQAPLGLGAGTREKKKLKSVQMRKENDLLLLFSGTRSNYSNNNY